MSIRKGNSSRKNKGKVTVPRAMYKTAHKLRSEKSRKMDEKITSKNVIVDKTHTFDMSGNDVTEALINTAKQEDWIGIDTKTPSNVFEQRDNDMKVVTSVLERVIGRQLDYDIEDHNTLKIRDKIEARDLKEGTWNELENLKFHDRVNPKGFIYNGDMERFAGITGGNIEYLMGKNGKVKYTIIRVKDDFKLYE